MENSRWIQAGINESRPLWGLRDGIQIAIWPGDIESKGEGGPRGLFRIGYPIRDGGKSYGLVNFIAVEPIVNGKRGFSELERSEMDGKPGRVFWTGTPEAPGKNMDGGVLTEEDGIERLRVTFYMETFTNGAHPIVEMAIRADRPDEARFTVKATPDSAPMEFCILTATMGNYMRLRELWLNDGVMSAKAVWPDFVGDEFTSEAFFLLEQLPHSRNGDLLICSTSDEQDPGAVPVDPRAPWWRYRGDFPLTQYWRKPAGTWQETLRLRVNGRQLYWANHTVIPGGLAYENFDLVEPFSEGQQFVFGLSRKTPRELIEET